MTPTNPEFLQHFRTVSDAGPAYRIGNANNDQRYYLIGDAVAADFNGDGRQDVFIVGIDGAGSTWRSVPPRLLLNQGDGTFTDGIGTLLEQAPSPIYARRVDTTDFNADGRPDFFIANHGWDALPFPGETNSLILSSSQTRLTNASDRLPQTNGFTHALAVGPINGDGIQHVYVGNTTLSHLDQPYLLINDGRGNFTKNTSRLPAEILTWPFVAFTAAFVDVNGDGFPDLVLGSGGGSSRRSRVLLNDGHGSFASRQAIELPAGCFDTVSGSSPESLVLSIAGADIREAGVNDLIIMQTRADPAYVGGCVQVLVNDGHGNFRDESTARGLGIIETGGGSLKKVAAISVNGDGVKDLIIQSDGVCTTCGSRPTNRNTLFVNNGSGIFRSLGQDYLPTFNWPDGNPSFTDMVVPVDVRGNGRLGLVQPYTAIDPDGTLKLKFAVHEQIADPTGRTVVPQTGWWWNPSEPGRGFAIERRGTNLYIGTFLYDGAGRGVWYAAGGPMSGSSFSASLEQYGGERSEWGPTTGVTHVATIGPVSMTFSTSRTGTLTWPGRSMSIERFEFIPGGATSGPVGWAPETGWYWNLSESGRGWFVETQGNAIFVAIYTYSLGRPVWFAGTLQPTSGTVFQGAISEYCCGQTLSGQYQPPVVSFVPGTITIQFTPLSQAIVTLPSGSQTILQRFRF